MKEKVKSVMNYKKPAFWIVAPAVVACVVVAVFTAGMLLSVTLTVHRRTS